MVVFASLGDYLYIIIGIVWLVFSVYKGQKKKNSRSESPQKSSGKSFLDTLMDEFNPEPAVESVPYIKSEPGNFVSKEVPVDEPTLFSYDDQVEESNEYETSVVYTKREFGNHGSQPVIHNNIIDKQQYRRRGGFNLRKAVIYSEVLNRRYF